MPAGFKPNWIYFADGPLAGQRQIRPPQERGAELIHVTASNDPRIQEPTYEYRVTAEYRRGEKEGGMILGTARVAKFVRDCGVIPPDPNRKDPRTDAWLNG